MKKFKNTESAQLCLHHKLHHMQDILNAGEPEKILEISEFSMLRLNDIGEQRKLFSSVDDIVYAASDDSDYDEPYENSKFAGWLQKLLIFCWLRQKKIVGVYKVLSGKRFFYYF